MILHATQSKATAMPHLHSTDLSYAVEDVLIEMSDTGGATASQRGACYSSS